MIVTLFEFGVERGWLRGKARSERGRHRRLVGKLGMWTRVAVGAPRLWGRGCGSDAAANRTQNRRGAPSKSAKGVNELMRRRARGQTGSSAKLPSAHLVQAMCPAHSDSQIGRLPRRTSFSTRRTDRTR
ncbi:hypothetical protein L1887_62539 [Cichorium endivia]|nr:hypothetical protein L1887_62539 [Cichorium endivia]